MSDAHTLQDDDGFHEIQLNGKQLVFLGMTTTLVSVVIFLCGVLVGRGVKPIEPIVEASSARATPAPETAPVTPDVAPPPMNASASPATGQPAAAVPPAPEPTPASTPRRETKVAAAAAAETTPDPAPVDEAANESKSASAPADAAKSAAKPAAAAPAPAAVHASAAEAEPKGAPPSGLHSKEMPAPAVKSGSIAVQVAALANRADAEAVARRLSGKGYAAYVLNAENGAKQVYKVRVGNYASADEAMRVSRRLQQEEKLQPWVIR